ncbi:MAG TPA: condensation domain-containing protein, partial [Candidatus Portnoybacteria bacterium]|nr:condensation domain-containing protein [Candidatus Portnoybacteria bacterium]
NLNLADVAYTLQVGRAEFNHRLAVAVKNNLKEAIKGLKNKAKTSQVKEDITSLNSHHQATSQAQTTQDPNLLSSLWLKGAKIDWIKLYQNERRRRLPLPTYPFERQRYWPGATGIGLAKKEEQPTKEASPIVSVPVLHSRPDLAIQFKSPGTELELMLSKIWREVLGIKDIGINDNFFEIGGNSLHLVQVANQIKQALNINMPVAKLFEHPTINLLAKIIEKNRSNKRVFIAPAFKAEFYPLSHAQKRIWVLYQMEPNSPFYNISVVCRLLGKLESALLSEAIKNIISRHEILRTNFKAINGEPKQVVNEKQEPDLIYLDLSGKKQKETNKKEEKIIQQEINQPFKLESDRLIRFRLIKAGAKKHTLMMVMHHIISDGKSADIILAEISELYSSFLANKKAKLPQNTIQYKDYSCWESSEDNEKSMQQQEKYWLKKLSGSLPILDLPLDKTRPASQTYNGRLERSVLRGATVNKLRQLANQTGSTLFALLFSAFNVFIYKLTGQTDIILGTLATNRDYPELEKTVGILFNNIASRNKLDEEERFLTLLGRVKQNISDDLANKDYPLDRLTEKLGAAVGARRNSIFNVVMQNDKVDMKMLNLPKIKVEKRIYATNTSKFDIKLRIMDDDSALILGCEFNTDIFYQETIKRWLGYYANILDQIANGPETKIKDFDLLNEKERKRLISGKYR